MVSSNWDSGLFSRPCLCVLSLDRDVFSFANKRSLRCGYLLSRHHYLLYLFYLVRDLRFLYLRFHLMESHPSFHTLSNHSPGTWQLTSHLDHLGIVVVIWGSTIASDHFGFYCDSHLQNIYKTTVCPRFFSVSR